MQQSDRSASMGFGFHTNHGIGIEHGRRLQLLSSHHQSSWPCHHLHASPFRRSSHVHGARHHQTWMHCLSRGSVRGNVLKNASVPQDYKDYMEPLVLEECTSLLLRGAVEGDIMVNRAIATQVIQVNYASASECPACIMPSSASLERWQNPK